MNILSKRKRARRRTQNITEQNKTKSIQKPITFHKVQRSEESIDIAKEYMRKGHRGNYFM